MLARNNSSYLQRLTCRSNRVACRLYVLPAAVAVACALFTLPLLVGFTSMVLVPPFDALSRCSDISSKRLLKLRGQPIHRHYPTKLTPLRPPAA